MFIKLRKKDVVAISVLAVLLSILTFFSATASFYDLERGNAYALVVSKILFAPLIITVPLGYLFVASSRDPEGASLGFGILITFLSPVFAFVFWFLIFWFLSVLVKKVSAKDSLWKHTLSIILVIVLVSPYAYYKFGSNSVKACLSGALNSQMMSGSAPGLMEAHEFTVGTDSCFDNIISSYINKSNQSSKKTVNFCLDLSASEIVSGTDTTYRDYCIYALGSKLYPNKSQVPDFTTDFHKTYLSERSIPTPKELIDQKENNTWWATYTSKLCDVYGTSTGSETNKNQCLIHFLNGPLYPDANMSAVYCGNITTLTLPPRCLVKPELTSVSVNINDSKNPAPIKFNSPFVVSWSIVGKAQRCAASGSFAPRADGKGIWGTGDNHIIPTNGSVVLIAKDSYYDRSTLGFEVECSPDATQPVKGIVRDSVLVDLIR